MPFPKSDRVVYDINPLNRVICQLRFPEILRIEKELPSNFQELIRDEYPEFSSKYEDQPDIPTEILDQMPAQIANIAVRGGKKRLYEFISDDDLWKISLGRGFIALSTKRYVRWEEFEERFHLAFTAIIECYTPSYFSRLGLRYQNIICQRRLGIGRHKWSELLMPHISGVLNGPRVQEESVLNVLNNIEIQLADTSSIVRVVHGLVEADYGEKERCYLIDNDFFTDKRIPIDETIEKLLYFHKRSGRLFRWCIDDRLHEALRPKVIESA